MSEIWYEAWDSFNTIKQVEVEKSTESSVYINGRRRAKLGGWAYFRTWDEAKDYLVARHTDEVAAARRQLEYANAKLGNAKGIKRPAQPQDAPHE